MNLAANGITLVASGYHQKVRNGTSCYEHNCVRHLPMATYYGNRIWCNGTSCYEHDCVRHLPMATYNGNRIWWNGTSCYDHNCVRHLPMATYGNNRIWSLYISIREGGGWHGHPLWLLQKGLMLLPPHFSYPCGNFSDTSSLKTPKD